MKNTPKNVEIPPDTWTVERASRFFASELKRIATRGDSGKTTRYELLEAMERVQRKMFLYVTRMSQKSHEEIIGKIWQEFGTEKMMGEDVKPPEILSLEILTEVDDYDLPEEDIEIPPMRD